LTRYKVAVIAGDGIGPEVIGEGVKVINAAIEKVNLSIEWCRYPFGADHYLSTGELLTEHHLKELKEKDAIYFGAIGDPRVKPGILEKGILLKLRFYFDQYVNLRPVKLYPGVETPLKNKRPEDIDFYVVRENTEDFYVGLGGRASAPTSKMLEVKSGCAKGSKYAIGVSPTCEQAFQIGVVSREGCRRIIKFAFEFAVKKNRKSVTCVDKANVLTEVYGLWREVFEEVSREYPTIEKNYAFVDAITMWFVKNPENYDVVVAPNMFGDIITDLGAMIQGGLGFAAGGNINPEGISMFEPIHGSAPKYKGLNVANPIASILAGMMMLEELGRKHSDSDMFEAAKLIDKAVEIVLKEGKVRTRDMGGSNKTYEMGDAIVEAISKL